MPANTKTTSFSAMKLLPGKSPDRVNCSSEDIEEPSPSGKDKSDSAGVQSGLHVCSANVQILPNCHAIQDSMTFRIFGLCALLLLTAGCSDLQSLLSFDKEPAATEPVAIVAPPPEPALPDDF